MGSLHRGFWVHARSTDFVSTPRLTHEASITMILAEVPRQTKRTRLRGELGSRRPESPRSRLSDGARHFSIIATQRICRKAGEQPRR